MFFLLPSEYATITTPFSVLPVSAAEGLIDQRDSWMSYGTSQPPPPHAELHLQHNTTQHNTSMMMNLFKQNKITTLQRQR
jgi:hypothetical protein